MITRNYTAVIVCASVICNSALAAEQPQPALSVRLEEYDRLDRAAKDEWLIRAKVLEKRDFELAVVHRFESATRDDERVDMAWLIGLYKISRGADALCSHIKLTDWRHQRLVGESAWPMNAAEAALCELGSAANPALSRLITRTDDKMEMMTAVSVLRTQGAEVAEAILRHLLSENKPGTDSYRRILTAIDELAWQKEHGFAPRDAAPSPAQPTSKSSVREKGTGTE